MNNNTWISAHLYHSYPWESFLIQGVIPFIKKITSQGLIKNFFFIRYWEKGPHIRLRIKVSNENTEKVKQEIKAYFSGYFKLFPSERIEPNWHRGLPPEEFIWYPNNTLFFIDYIPELERYGGTYGIEISESQFELSSKVVLDILNNYDDWNYDLALGKAIQLHLGFVYSMGMNKDDIFNFFKKIFINIQSEFLLKNKYLPEKKINERHEILNSFKKSFNNSKKEFVDYHNNVLTALQHNINFEQDWFNLWVKETKIIFGRLRSLYSSCKLVIPDKYMNLINGQSLNEKKLWYLFESYVHMTNNRIGISNHDEVYLAYVIMMSIKNINN